MVEAIIALAIFALTLTSIFSLAAGSLSFFTYARSERRANELVQEALVALRSISYSDWSAFEFDRSALDSSSGRWLLAGEGTAEEIDGFVRTIDFYDVYRDAEMNMVASTAPDAVFDGSSKKAVVTISWQSERGADNEKIKTVYLVNYP